MKKKKDPQGGDRRPSVQRIATIIGYTVIFVILLGAGTSLIGLGLWLFSLINWGNFFTNIDTVVLLDYIKVLVWPAFFTLVLVVLRKDIRHLLQRLVRANLPGGFTGEFKPSQQPPSNSEIEEINDVNESVETPPQLDEESAFNNPEIRLAFERVYRNIFATQFLALNFLAANPGPVSASHLSHLYDRHKQAMESTPYTNINDLMNYLVSFNLAAHNTTNDTYEILPAGSLFLRYMASQGLTADGKNY